MYVPIYPRLLAALLLFASLAGSAQAVEFDEKLKAPLVKEVAALHSQAQSYLAKFSTLKDAAPEQLIRDRALDAERFDLVWKIQRAIDTRQPLGDLSALGLERQDDGSYRLDNNANPQWEQPGEFPSGWLPQVVWEGFGKDLINRGFRPEDVERLRNYVETHDAEKLGRMRSVPVAVSFSKIVKKFDRIKRPVDDALVLSYLYQRDRIRAEATREWAEGLLNTLDAQRSRIFLAFFEEMTSTSIWAPSNQRAGIDGLLELMRLPDYEERVKAELAGGQS